MAEAIGLVLGVGGLAGLFGATVDAFDQIKAAKSYSRDFEILSTMYDMRRATLLQWGTAVGLADGGASKTLSRWSNSDLRPLVERALNCIQMILTDTEELQEKYGLRRVQAQVEDQYESFSLLGTSLSRQRLRDFKSSYNRFRTSIRDRQKNTSMMRKTQWAIFDRGEFRQLLQDLGVLIDDLYKLVPMSLIEQARLIEEDASTLPNDIEHIRLIEEAREALAEDQAAEDPEDLFEVSNSTHVPEEAHLNPLEARTAPPSASFMDAARSRPAVVQSPAFASVASSNASWATALSHRASMIEARSPMNPKISVSSTCVKYSVGTCPSVQMMLQDQLAIEVIFRQTLPSEACETADVAFECGGGCLFSLPFRFRAGADVDETSTNTNKVYYSKYEKDGIQEIFAWRAKLLAKSHMRQRAYGADSAQYCCLICRLLMPDSLDIRPFIGIEAILSHLASHAGETISEITFSGSITFFGNGLSMSADNFDIDFLGVEDLSAALESGPHSTLQNVNHHPNAKQSERPQTIGKSTGNLRARRIQADSREEYMRQAFGAEQWNCRLKHRQPPQSEWVLDQQSLLSLEKVVRESGKVNSAPEIANRKNEANTSTEEIEDISLERLGRQRYLRRIPGRNEAGDRHDDRKEKMREGSLERVFAYRRRHEAHKVNLRLVAPDDITEDLIGY
jgi:hypothetical protein